MAGRPRKKPEYNPELQFNNFLQELRDAYEEAEGTWRYQRSFIYLSDTMEIWSDKSSGSNREENGKVEINPCFYYLRTIRLTWIYYRVSRKINMKKDTRLLMNVSNEKLK